MPKSPTDYVPLIFYTDFFELSHRELTEDMRNYTVLHGYSNPGHNLELS